MIYIYKCSTTTGYNLHYKFLVLLENCTEEKYFHRKRDVSNIRESKCKFFFSFIKIPKRIFLIFHGHGNVGHVFHASVHIQHAPGEKKARNDAERETRTDKSETRVWNSKEEPRETVAVGL